MNTVVTLDSCESFRARVTKLLYAYESTLPALEKHGQALYRTLDKKQLEAHRERERLSIETFPTLSLRLIDQLRVSFPAFFTPVMESECKELREVRLSPWNRLLQYFGVRPKAYDVFLRRFRAEVARVLPFLHSGDYPPGSAHLVELEVSMFDSDFELLKVKRLWTNVNSNYINLTGLQKGLTGKDFLSDQKFLDKVRCVLEESSSFYNLEVRPWLQKAGFEELAKAEVN
jgi:hypothetical protein